MRRPGMQALARRRGAGGGRSRCPASPARADAVTDWNVIALNATAVPPNSILQSRALAIVHAAIYDAVRAVEPNSAAYAMEIKRRRHLDASGRRRGGPRRAGAARAGAAADAGRRAEPRPGQDCRWAGQDRWDRLGEQVAETSSRCAAATVPTPRSPSRRSPASVSISRRRRTRCRRSCRNGARSRRSCCAARPDSSSTGRPPPAAPQFARDFDEVKSLGARNSTTRRADQTAAAIFWTVQTAVPWHAAARAVSAARGLSIAENARLFALLSMATADSQIVAFDGEIRAPALAADHGDPRGCRPRACPRSRAMRIGSRCS